MISNILVNNYLRFVVLAGRRLASTQSNVNIGDQMKILNDNKQYKKALELFDEFNEKTIDKCSNWIIIQALKACTQICDVQRGLKIHNLISSRLKQDPYVLPSLIHFYMQCGDMNRAQLLFDTSTKKTLPMYGAMMKGYIKNNLPKKVIDLFNEIEDPDRVIIILLFNACAQLGTTEELNLIKRILSNIPESLFLEPTLSSPLIHVFMKCGDVTSAKSLFDRSTKKTISMYGAMMKGFIINNSSKQAIDLFNEIKDPNEIIITLFFNACAQLGTEKELLLLKSISSKISNSFYSDPYVVTSLIDAFMKCGDVTSAKALFDRSSKKTTPVYGAMMKGFIINNLSKQAIDLFNEIKDPNEVTVNLFFNACAQLGTEKELLLLKSISSKISNSFYSDPYVVTSLIDAFMKCGDVTSAKALFDRSTKKTTPVYGAMMKGFIINKLSKQALDLFNEIKDPNEVTVNLFFNACAQLGTEKELLLLKSISSKISNSFYSDPYVVTSLIDAFMKCGDVTSAKALFDKSTMKTAPMYGAIMTGLIVNDQEEEAIDIFNEIRLDELHRENHRDKKMKLSDMESDRLESNITIYLSLIKALAKLGMLEKAESFVQQIPTSFLTDHRIQNALIHMWGKVGSVDKAKRIFEKISQPDHIAWTAMINSYGLNGMGIEAMKLFHQMPKELINDLTYTCILNSCSHSGLVDEARSIFNSIETKTDITVTTMIDCLSRAAAFEEAQQLIEQFEHNHAPALPIYSLYS
ncbi:unnamed protein product [Rotaria magnacalcarata]